MQKYYTPDGQIIVNLQYDNRLNRCTLEYYDAKEKKMVILPVPPRRMLDAITAQQANLEYERGMRLYWLKGYDLGGGMRGALRIPEIVLNLMKSRYQPEQIRKKNNQRIW